MPSSIYWDRIADRYALEKPRKHRIREHRLAKTLRFLRPHMEVLEIGCGAGMSAIQQAPYVKRIRAIDYSQSMISIAETRRIYQGIENVAFECESISDIARDHRFYDLVVAYDVLHLVPNMESVLQSVFDHLNPGGFFISATPCLGGGFKLLRPIWPLMCSLGIAPKTRFMSKDFLVNSIQSGGFKMIASWSAAGPDLLVVGRKPRRQ